jgi:SPP1 family predicted phage head-tail adaptor
VARWTFDAGQIRHRVAIQSPTRGPKNATGEEPVTWGTVTTVWASIEPLSGRELDRARQVQPDTTHRVRFRHQPGVAIGADWRLVHEGRVFHLAEPPRDLRELDWLLEVLCVEAT